MPKGLTDKGAIIEAAMEIQCICQEWEPGDDRENRAHPAGTWLSEWDERERQMMRRIRTLGRYICRRVEQTKREPLNVRSA